MEKYMGLIAWIIFGALAGWLATMVTGDNERTGALGNIVIGIAGAIIGGYVAGALDIGGVSGFNLSSLLVAVVGSVLLLFVIGIFRGKSA